MPADRPQRLVFGEVAEDYDRFRPTYPTELVDLLIERASPDGAGPDRVLDIGSGTGRSAVAMADRGLGGHAVEADAEMAAVARRNLPDSWTVETSDFEDCLALGRSDWPLATCAQAWHWIDHERGLARARALLAPGGTLAIFWNRPAFDDTPLRREMDEVYDRLAPDMQSSMRGRGARSKGSDHPIAGADGPPAGFADVEEFDLWWEQTYSTAQWIGLLGTHSDHRLLDEGRRRSLHAEIGAVIERHGGSFVLPYRVAVVLFTASR